MAQLRFPVTPLPPPALRHVRAPRPLHFPEAEEVPEGKRHLIIRTFLFRVLQYALAPAHSVGSDQFVYWNAREPRRCLSPDAFVKLDVPDTVFGSWKTWERGGVPELAVEIISPNEGDGVAWEEKLARYHELGVSELLRFDPEAREGQRLRAWDRLRDDLVERQVEEDQTPCVTLGLAWRVCPIPGDPAAPRLADASGNFLETPEEFLGRARAEEARLRAEADRARGQESNLRAAAEARVLALEDQLSRLQRPPSR